MTCKPRLEEEVSLQVLRTANGLEHAFSECFKSFGLTMTQYNALRILRGAEPDGLCRNEVRDRLLAPVPDATRLLDRLIAAGYAQKEVNPNDKRYVTAKITSEGLALLAKMDEPVLEMHRKQLNNLSQSELEQLASLLKSAKSD